MATRRGRPLFKGRKLANEAQSIIPVVVLSEAIISALAFYGYSIEK